MAEFDSIHGPNRCGCTYTVFEMYAKHNAGNNLLFNNIALQAGKWRRLKVVEREGEFIVCILGSVYFRARRGHRSVNHNRMHN